MLDKNKYISKYTNLTAQEDRQLFYKRKYKKQNKKWDDSMVLLRDLVDKYLDDKISVLDVGCGHGNFVIDELRDKFVKAVGIDCNKEGTEKNVCLDEVMIGNIESTPFEDKKFDLVVSLWMLEHIKNPEKVFLEINRVIKNGGYFAFVTPNKFNFLIFLRRLIGDRVSGFINKIVYGREEKDLYGVYYKANSVSKIKKLAKICGYEIVFLKNNVDPSYTSFGRISYYISFLISLLPFSFVRPHIVGVLRKAKITI